MKRLLFLFLLSACVQAAPTIVPKLVKKEPIVVQYPDTGTADATGFLELRKAPWGVGQVHRSGWLEPLYRDSVLAKTWPTGIVAERGWCVTRWSILSNIAVESVRPMNIKIDTMYVVWQMEEQTPTYADAMEINFKCPAGMPKAHYHPNYSCTNNTDLTTCTPGGWTAFQCQPSDVDYTSLVTNNHPFGIIVCGPNQVRFFYQAEFLASRWKGTPGIPEPRPLPFHIRPQTK